MVVLQIQRICICALKKERKQILELLQRLGVIEINDAIPEDSIFKRMDVSMAETLLEKSTHSAREALQILDNYAPEKKAMLSMLNGRSLVGSDQYDNFSVKRDSTLHSTNHIISLAKEIAENKAEILKLQTQIEILTPWMGLDIPINFEGTKTTSGFIGTLPNEWTLDMIYEQLSEFMPLNADIISSSRDQTNVFVLCTKEKAELVSDKLRANGFSYPMSASEKAPAEQIKGLESQIEKAKQVILSAEEEIKSSAKLRGDIQFLEDYDSMRSEKYEVIGHLVQSNKVFFITGYIAEKESAAVEKALNEKYDLAIEFSKPSKKEDVPVILENNGFSAPLESTVESYSLPGKGETDPTMVMSLFYYMLFGLMLSDAVYGAIIVFACGFGLLKFKNTIEKSMRNTLKMFLFCGISTMFWGVMFGSYLGDIVDVVSTTFFGQTKSIDPIWFFPVKDPMRMLVFSMMLGVIHLYAGLGMKLYQCIKQKDIKSAIYDVLLWYLLLSSCIIALLATEVFTNILGLDFILSTEVGNISGIVAIISSIGIILTNGRESRNPFKRFLKGLYAFYGITGYLSDVLSYSRLLALGLATGVICTVINKMAGMTAKGPLGIVIFIIVIVIGHSLNIAINALGAYVHTNRLQYVEFFGKFYEGGGRPFKPFSVKTKYYKFKETMKNE